MMHLQNMWFYYRWLLLRKRPRDERQNKYSWYWLLINYRWSGSPYSLEQMFTPMHSDRIIGIQNYVLSCTSYDVPVLFILKIRPNLLIRRWTDETMDSILHHIPRTLNILSIIFPLYIPSPSLFWGTEMTLNYLTPSYSHDPIIFA